MLKKKTVFDNFTSQQVDLLSLNSIFNWLENVCVSHTGAGNLHLHIIF